MVYLLRVRRSGLESASFLQHGGGRNKEEEARAKPLLLHVDALFS